MKDQIERRLRELRAEYEEGQRMLAELQTRQTKLHETLLRIAGAILALEEMIQEPGPLAEEGGAEAAAPQA